MRAYIFFSIHEEVFHRMALGLRDRGVNAFAGFMWGKQQLAMIGGRGIDYDPALVFTRDLLPHCDDGKPPDLAWLERREKELGISIRRMLAAERHLLAGRSHQQIMRMAEVALREIDAAYTRFRPDFVFSEDVSCFHSYVHFVLAREHGIPFWCLSSGRLPRRVIVYSGGYQRSERVEALYREISNRGPTEQERAVATEYIERFRAAPARPTGMDRRAQNPRIGVEDVSRFGEAFSRYAGDRDDPTVTNPLRVIKQRVNRIVRNGIASATGLFEPPLPEDKYVLYPIQFQPEASTLVQAPYYLDQVVLLEDIAKSLPIGHRLYVKEHLSNRGRRPLDFYHAIRRIPGVRLLGPDEDTWSLIANAAAIAVITGTMGWEGLLFGKPVVTFGDVWFNVLPHVHKADELPKDRWYELFSRALGDHRPDHAALVAFVAALHGGTYPGFFGNARVFHDVLDDDNITKLTDALGAEAIGESGRAASAR
jgi:hypothetical protein